MVQLPKIQQTMKVGPAGGESEGGGRPKGEIDMDSQVDYDFGLGFGEPVATQIVEEGTVDSFEFEPLPIPALESLNKNSGGSSSKEINFFDVPADEVIAWDDTQEAILNSYIADMQEWGGPDMQALAKRLRLKVADFEEIIVYSTEKVWNRKRMKRLLEIEASKMRGFKWDHVEYATLAKLEALVDAGKIQKPGELLMIASTANRAQRRGSGLQEDQMKNPIPPGGPNQAVQVNIFGQPVPGQATDLPGAGHVGTVRLSLNQRTIKQLSQERVIDSTDYQRLHERAEMLEAKDITELSKLADEENE